MVNVKNNREFICKQMKKKELIDRLGALIKTKVYTTY